MKAESIGKFNKVNQQGSSLIEILIAVAVLSLGISAVILLVFANQNLKVDAQTNNEALSLAKKMLENARASAKSSFGSIVSSSPSSPPGYTSQLAVTDNGLCEKWLTGTVGWSISAIRSLSINLSTDLSDPALALALGGDCGGAPPGSPPGGGGGPTWTKPRLFASYKFNPGQPVSLDVLNRIVYVTDDAGKLNIADTSGATLGLVHGAFASPAFDATSTLTAIDVAKWHDPVTGVEKRYAYVSRGHYPSCNSADNKNQFEVIEVTTPSAPAFIKSRTLQGLSPPTGTCPGGWKIFYFDNRVYITTRETSGFEFHIFNVSDPTQPAELGPGFQVNGTTNDIFVTGVTVNGIPRRVAYLATDRSSNELMVLDVTDANTPSLIGSVNLPTNNDAFSVYLVGNRIYLGREDTGGGPELFIYDASYGVDGSGNLTVTLTQIGTGAEIGADVDHIRISGKFAFLATSKSNDEFQVWNISDPATGITRIDTDSIKLPNKIVGGMDFENPYIYVGSQATDPLQILYSSP